MKPTEIRYVAIVVAVFALTVGIVVFTVPGAVVDRFGPESIVVLESLGQLVFYLVLVGLLGLAYRVVKLHVEAPPGGATVGTPETARGVPAPGDDLARTVRGVSGRTDDAYGRVRNRLRCLVISLLVDRHEYNRTEAREAVEAGSWTDDDRAAAALAETTEPNAGSFGGRLRSLLLGRGWTARDDLRAAMAAVAAVAGVGDRLNSTRITPSRTTVGETPRHEDVTRATRHWNGVVVVALLALVGGVLYEAPGVLLAAAVGIGFAAYARAISAPEPELSVDRHVSDPNPSPSDCVEVTVTVHNEGDPTHDLRIVDGVPPALEVTKGSPRLGTALGADESVSWRYTVAARRGSHRFEPVRLLARNLNGSMEAERNETVETVVDCLPVARPLANLPPIEHIGPKRAGSLVTNDPGRGVQFHSVQKYHPGDPVSTIDWKRYARTGELATVAHEDERSASTVAVIDARETAYLGTGRSGHAVDRSVEAAADVVATITGAGHRAGVTSIASDSLWVAPGAGRRHLVRVRDALGTHPSVGPLPPTADGYSLSQFARLRADETGLWLFSPLCDDAATDLARMLQARGFALTVVSPDPTDPGRLPGAIAHAERAVRIRALRRRGLTVLDWLPDESLERALEGSD